MYTRLQKGIETCFLLLFLVTPLLMFHKTSELFEFNKMLFVYLLTFIIVAFWVGKMIISEKIIIKRTPLDIPLLLFVLSQIASTIFSIDTHTSIFGYYSRFNGGLLSIVSYVILYYAFVSNCIYQTKEETYKFIIKILKMTLISSLIVILWGLPGKFGYDLTCFVFAGSLNNSCWTDQFHPSERMFSTLGQPNWLGSFLAVTFFIALFFYVKKRFKKKYQIIYTVFLFLTFTAIIFTRSRSALVALLAGLSIILFIYRKQIVAKRREAIWFFIIIVVIPVVIFKTGISSIDKWLPKFSSLNLVSKTIITSPNNTNKATAENITESFDIRRIVWRGAWQLGLQYPSFGTGVETFAYSYNFVRPKEHNLTSEWDLIYNKAHNEYLNYLATTGFVGLGSYLLFIIYYLLFIFKKRTENSDAPLIHFLTIAWITILITNFFGFSTVVTNIYFYLLPALCVALFFGKSTAITTTNTAKIKLAQITTVISIIGGIWFTGSYILSDISYANGDALLKSQEYDKAAKYFKAALLLRNEHVYKDKLSTALANEVFFDAYQNSLSNNTKDQKKNDALQKQINDLFAEADKLNLESIKASPKNVLYWKTRAKNYYILYQLTENEDDYKTAINALDTAQKLAPTDPKILYSKVLFYLSRTNSVKNKKIDTIESNNVRLLSDIDMAISLKPDYRDAYFAKAMLLKRLNKADEAKKTLEYILHKINPDDSEVKDELAK